MKQPSFLVVGDVLVDRTWIVASAPSVSTSQAHLEVPPKKRVGPCKKSEALGGAGLLARSVVFSDPTAQVHLVGAWAEGMQLGEFIPVESGRNRAGAIKPCLAANVPFTREITRVYEISTADPLLIARYDRDVPTGRQTARNFSWPDRKGISVVLVLDQARGLFDLPEIKKGLSEYDSCTPLLLRAKKPLDDAIYEDLDWTIALPNRQDFARWFPHRAIPASPVLRKVAGKYVLHPDVIASFNELPDRFKQRAVLLKLDREGAVLLEAGTLTALALKDAGQDATWTAIGAGDILMASLAIQFAHHGVLDKVGACKRSVKAATAHCRRISKLGGLEECHGITSSVDEKEIAAVEVIDQKLEPLSDLVKRSAITRSYPEIIDKNDEIRLHEATWYLQDFLTVNTDLGSDILRVKTAIAAYLESKDLERKPFLAAICGEPGAGKSALADALGKSLECDVVPSNAAQWLSIDDLFSVCEAIRTSRVRERKALAFIDEVDSKVDGDWIYGKLLAPVWDGRYSLKGQVIPIGPAVFIIAGSNEVWRDKGKLLDTEKISEDSQPKLRDLVSRLSALPIQVPNLKDRRADAVYICVNFLRERFPRAGHVEQGLLKYIAGSELLHGPRSIGYVVSKIAYLKDETVIACDDLKVSAEELRLHMKPTGGDSWQRETKRIRIGQ